MRILQGLSYCLIIIAANTSISVLAAPKQECSELNQLSPSLLESINANKDIWKQEGCASVRHIQSGTLCQKFIRTDWPLNRLIVFPEDTHIARGDDVACDYAIPNDGFLTIYITHFDQAPDDEEGFQSIKAAILSRFPDAKPVKYMSLGNETLRPFTALYEIQFEDKKYRTGVWYQTIKGWEVKVRSTFPAESITEAEIIELESVYEWFVKAKAIDDGESE